MSTTSPSKKLSPSDWATIVTLAERGEKNVRDLADMFGVARQSIEGGLKARGIVMGSRLSEVVGEVEDAVRAAREAKVKNANHQVETYAKYNDILAKLTMKRIIEGDQAGDLATKNADILVLKNGIAIIEKARAENWDILKLEELLGENAELPDLNIGEYTPEELEAIRAANEEHYLESTEDEVVEADGHDSDEE